MAKKTKGQKASLAKSFIQLQIEVKSKEILELKKEVKELEAKKQKHIELLEQQQKPISVLHKEEKQQEKNLKEKILSNKEPVEKAVQYNIELAHIQEEELAELQSMLTSTQARIDKLKELQQASWLYENVQKVEHQQQIQKLESELNSIETNFQAMSENIEHTLKEDICMIDKKTLHLIEKQRLDELEKVENDRRTDKCYCEMFSMNDWLKKEVAIYHEDVSLLDAAVKNLEEENLELTKQLFDLHHNDAQIFSNVFLTQTGDLEKKLSLAERTEESGKEQHQQSGELEEDEMDPSCKPTSPTHHLSALLYCSQSDPMEPLHLGLLEQKLLSVVGQAMPLHPLPSDPEDLKSLTQLGLLQAQEGSFTTNIILNKFQ